MMSEELVPWLVMGYLLLAIIGSFICYFWIVGIGFSEGALQGLGCMFCGPYGFYFCVTRWQRCKTPFLLSLLLNIGMVFAQFQSVESRPVEQLFATIQEYKAAARETDAERVARDVRNLQGKWKLSVAANKPSDYEVFEFDGGHCVVTGVGVKHQFEFLLTRSGFRRMIDLTNPQSGEKLQGIYYLNGDDFTLCLSGPGKQRPDNFSNWGDEQRSFVLKRSREEGEGDDSQQNAQYTTGETAVHRGA